MADFDRRDFLKLVGVGAGAAAASGCSELPEQLIPYVIQPEEITPGVPLVYASTCQECSVGCGVHVRTREGRPIKLEGNPEHPINRGKLCGRGQAALSRTYHPDRYRSPIERASDGTVQAVGWEAAVSRLAGAIASARGKVAVLGGPAGPTLDALIDRWLEAVGGGMRVVYEPFATEALTRAAEVVFGRPTQPVFDLEGSDLVLDFGSDCLSTGLSPVEHARQLAVARDASVAAGLKARLVYVGPRQDETASQADEWLAAKPGSEGLLALGLARAALDARRGDSAVAAALAPVLGGYDAASVSSATGVPAKTIRRLGAALAAAKRPAALPPGVALASRRAVATQAAVLALNAAVGATGSALKLLEAGSAPSRFRDMVRLVDAMRAGDIDVLIVHGGANPAHSLPADAGFDEALARVGLVVSTASMPDETSQRAHLVLPDHTAAESWGDAAPRPGVRSLVQPTLRPLFDTRALGDTLLDTARAMGTQGLPDGTFQGLVREAWQDTDWRGALQRGGVFENAASEAGTIAEGLSRLEFKEPQLEGDGDFVLLAVPSPLLGDGSGANLSLLQETPDPITKITWQSWAEISQNAAEKLGVGPGDVLAVETTYGKLEVPVWPRGGIRDDVVALAIGQGHTVGSFASVEPGPDGVGSARGVNVNDLLPALTDESGGRAWLAARANVSATGRFQRLPFTQGTDNKRGRLLGERISLVALARGESPWAANESPGEAHGPAAGHGEDHGEAGDGGAHGAAAVHHADPEGPPHQMRRRYDPVDDSTEDDPFRWGMTIDVDKCTGCSACIVACAVENNIPMVGEAGVLRSRQMHWLRIERYVGVGEQTLQVGRPGPQNNEVLGSTDVRNSPMLCQQCGAAPCEPVCPVYATYHTPSGLNGMIYNRCIGTRYCSNNCPYKVRRFNWFDYQIENWPEPMALGLNPDVTVRGQGVMEKCTFCIQRIQVGRLDAKGEGRELSPGEIQTACQQTCPSDAITFDNLKLPGNTATEAAEKNQARSYHALHVLNTRPAITYLAKVNRSGDDGHAGNEGH